MKISLGMAAGSAGVGSALLTRHSNGAQEVEYRYLSADQANTDTGDLVRSSIALMTTQVPTNPTTPDALAVAYRTEEQRAAIASALARGRNKVHMVPEADATLAYLRHTGEIAQYNTVAIVDIGASGTTVSVVDQVDGTVILSKRSKSVNGNAVDDLVYEHVSAALLPSTRRHIDERSLRARCRGIKEQLSVDSTSVVDIDHANVGPVEITFDEFASIISPVLRDLADFVRTTAIDSPRHPQAIALVGGGACIPAVAAAMQDAFDTRVVTLSEPDTATATGAALLATTGAVAAYPVAGAGEAAGRTSTTKVTGALLGALVVGGLVLGYGVRELAPSADPDVSPASTDVVRTTTEANPETSRATEIPSHDPVPARGESNVIVTTTIIPNPSQSHAAEHVPTTQDFTTTDEPTTTTDAPTTTTTPGTTPPSSQNPSTPGSDPTQPSWPHIEWPDIPTFWPQPPAQNNTTPNGAPAPNLEEEPEGFAPGQVPPSSNQEQPAESEQSTGVTTTTPPPPAR